jgi:hypothetical protein
MIAARRESVQHAIPPVAGALTSARYAMTYDVFAGDAAHHRAHYDAIAFSRQRFIMLRCLIAMIATSRLTQIIYRDPYHHASSAHAEDSNEADAPSTSVPLRHRHQSMLLTTGDAAADRL